MHTLMNLCEIPVDIMHSTDHVTDTVFLWLHLPRASIPKSIYQVTSYKLAIFIESVCCDTAGVCIVCVVWAVQTGGPDVWDRSLFAHATPSRDATVYITVLQIIQSLSAILLIETFLQRFNIHNSCSLHSCS